MGLKMNRFNFRIWDKRFNCYLDFDMDTGFWKAHVDDPNESYTYMEMFVLDNGEKFTIEQCTGAKDVDGNFIYEGDLLEVDIGCGKIQIVATWAETKFEFEKVGFNSLYLYDFEDTWLNSKKIIGNIHENKGEHDG